MVFTRKLLVFIIALVSTIVLKGIELSKEQRIEDILYFIRVVKENYPYLKADIRKNGYDWEKETQKNLSKYIEQDSIRDFLEELNQFKIGLNGHCDFLDRDFYLYAKSIYEDAVKKDKSLLKEYSPWMVALNNEKSRNTYKFEKNIEFKDQQTSSKTVINCLNDQFVYIKIPTFDMSIVDKDYLLITQFMKSHRNYNKLIIDIRGNSGGADLYWQKNLVAPFISKKNNVVNYSVFLNGKESQAFIKSKIRDLYPISELHKMKDEPIELRKDFKYFSKDNLCINPDKNHFDIQKIYILMDRSNFSSSEGFLQFCKKSGFATLIGENSAGDGGDFDPILIVLPNSGYIFRLPISCTLNEDGSINAEKGTTPDIKTKGNEALDYIINNLCSSKQ